MITQRAVNYAKVLYSLGLKEESVLRTQKLLEENIELVSIFENPVIERAEKEAIIEAIFDTEIGNFLKVLCENKCFEIFGDICRAYEKMILDSKNILMAQLSFSVRPSDLELEQIKTMICQKYNKADVSLELVEDASLIGGYVLTVGDTEYDKSIKGALQELQKTLSGR